MVMLTRDPKPILLLRVRSAIVAHHKSLRMVIQMARTLQYHVLLHPQCMGIICNHSTATIFQIINSITLHPWHHFIYDKHHLVDPSLQ